MNDKINNYINSLFEPYTGTKSVVELKNDLLVDLNERFNDLISQGMEEQSALNETLNSIGDIEVTLDEMANLTHTLERQVVMNFNAQDLERSDFAGVTLQGGSFESSVMKNVNFSNAHLMNASFKSSNMQGANFDGANLIDCKFSTLDLLNASFSKTNLRNTIFSKSGLEKARFSYAKLIDVNFSTIDLRNVIFEGCVIDGCEFKNADLRGQNFDGQIIKNTQLGKSALEDVSFKNATLQNVSFTPPFALSNKYYRAIRTIHFEDTSMDKLTYNALKGLGADLTKVTVL